MYSEEKCKCHQNLLLKGAKLVAIVAIAIGLFRCTSQAADEPKTNAVIIDTKTTVDSADSLITLREEADGVDAAYAAYSKVTDDAQKDKFWKTYVQTNDSLVPKILDGVRQYPTSPTAFGLLEWVLSNGRISAASLRPYNFQAIEILRDHYTSQTNISPICRELGLFGDPLNRPTVEFLQIAATNNPARAEQGAATFACACLTKRKAEEMAFWVNMPSSIYTNAAAQAVRATFLEEAKTRGPEVILHEAGQLFQTVKTDYADVPNFAPGPGLRKPEATLGERASIELYECQHLTVGKVVPEIQGEDIAGHKLRLSDYRGKVVLVSFWASWCGPCMQMVPHERAIAERLAGKPFVLIGVNGDSEKAAAERAMAEQKMTWQSFWNDGSAEGGIAGAWNVHAWPTVYVLDSAGTIRLKFNGYGGKKTDALLDAVVDKLLEETARL